MTRWWRSHSVRMRLTLWHAAAMVLVLSLYAIVTYTYVARSASESLNRQLSNDFWVAINTIDRLDDGTYTLMPPAETSEDEELLWAQVWSAETGRLLFQNFEAARRPVPESARLARSGRDGVVIVPAEPEAMRVLSRRNSIYGVPVVVQVARSEAAMRRELRGLVFILVVGLPLGVAIAGFGGYMLATGALAPIERMTERARTISAERLGDRLPVDNPDDEMGRLASVFNETLGRLEESFEQMRRFTADVSHELRTPLTSIRSVGEVGLMGHRDEARYRSIIGSMLEEADRLASLVDRLLTLSRAETHQSTLTSEALDLRRLAEDVAADLAVLAEEKRQSIDVEGAAAEVVADRLVLRQAAMNLVDNAIKFTPAGGRIRIRTTSTLDDAIIEVIDSGPGVPAAARAHIFDRFYRVDDGGLTRGTGLGLSIARGGVEAAGGRLTLESSGESGSTFRITLPRRGSARRRAG